MTREARLSCELLLAVELREQYEAVLLAWLATEGGTAKERLFRARHGRVLLAYELCLARINRLEKELRGEPWLAVVVPNRRR